MTEIEQPMPPTLALERTAAPSAEGSVAPESTAIPPRQGVARTPTNFAGPRLWGLTIAQLHDRFWRSRGLQVIRSRRDATVDLAADLYLLIEDRALALFRPGDIADRLYWNRASLMRLRLHDRRRRDYDERIVLDENGKFVGVRRIYDRLESRLVRFGVTADAKVAQTWIECAGMDKPWRKLCRSLERRERAAASVPGSCYFDDDDDDRADFIRHLTQVWREPDATIPELCQRGDRVWAYHDCPTDSTTRFVGPVWLGRGRGRDEPPLVVGPGVMWDLPRGTSASDAPEPEQGDEIVNWSAIRPSVMASRIVIRRRPRLQQVAKRLFDIAFSSVALLTLSPVLPIVMFAIWLEDGRPFFFGHVREKAGGAEFKCWKFRSMFRDAERRKADLQGRNTADGPQFFIPDDPRVTRVGRFLRRFNIDELPQFWNVLIGDMSVVGPRPSPRSENQFCPAWRDARLSVRPGVTGLWQVCRSRKGGNDFQEWIKYDMEYVQKNTFLFDLNLIWRSAKLCLRGETHSS